MLKKPKKNKKISEISWHAHVIIKQSLLMDIIETHILILMEMAPSLYCVTHNVYKVGWTAGSTLNSWSLGQYGEIELFILHDPHDNG